jgi:hypothetical protein
VCKATRLRDIVDNAVLGLRGNGTVLPGPMPRCATTSSQGFGFGPPTLGCLVGSLMPVCLTLGFGAW